MELLDNKLPLIYKVLNAHCALADVAACSNTQEWRVFGRVRKHTAALSLGAGLERQKNWHQRDVFQLNFMNVFLLLE